MNTKEIYLLIEGLHKHDRGIIWGFVDNKIEAATWKKSTPSNPAYIRYYNKIKNIDYMFKDKPKLNYWIRVDTTVKTDDPSSVSYKDNKPYLYGYEYTVITDDVGKIEEYFKKIFHDAKIARIQQMPPQKSAWLGSKLINLMKE